METGIAENIRVCRKQCGLTREQLSAMQTERHERRSLKNQNKER